MLHCRGEFVGLSPIVLVFLSFITYPPFLSFTKYIQSTRAKYNYDFEYHGERVTLGTNVNQCTADDGIVCDPNSMIADNPLVNTRPVYNYPYPSQNTFYWTDASCTQSVKVREDGMM
jgi:hypothetical protein